MSEQRELSEVEVAMVEELRNRVIGERLRSQFKPFVLGLATFASIYLVVFTETSGFATLAALGLLFGGWFLYLVDFSQQIDKHIASVYYHYTKLTELFEEEPDSDENSDNKL